MQTTSLRDLKPGKVAFSASISAPVQVNFASSPAITASALNLTASAAPQAHWRICHQRRRKSIAAWDELDVAVNRLCKFACKYGYRPELICSTSDAPDGDEPLEEGYDPQEYYDYSDVRWHNEQKCVLSKDKSLRDVSVEMCKDVCQDKLDEAAEEGRTTNWGCLGFWPLEKPIPWEQPPDASSPAAAGVCLCDNWLLNELADTIVEAIPAIAQVIFHSTLICTIALKS